MNINLELMKEIHGDEIEEIITANMDLIEENEETLRQFGFTQTEEIFEMYPSLFMNFPNQFKQKIEDMKKTYGEGFASIIENDLSLLEEFD